MTTLQARDSRDSFQIMNMEYPVGGIPANFDAVAEKFNQIRTKVCTLERDLSPIRSGQSDKFAGEAADKFKEKIGELDEGISTLGNISSRIAKIFADHADSLRALEREADSALARARVSWRQQQQAGEEANQASASARFFEQQLRSVGCEDGGYQHSQYELQLTNADYRYRSALRAQSEFASRVDDERCQWQNLARQEDALIDGTVAQLKSVDLGALADPSLFEKLLNTLAEAGVSIFSFIDEHLEVIHEILGFVIAILSILSLIFPVLAAVVFILAIVKAFAGLWLAIHGRMSWFEFAFDVVEVVLAYGPAMSVFTKTKYVTTIEKLVSKSRQARQIYVKLEKVEKYLDLYQIATQVFDWLDVETPGGPDCDPVSPGSTRSPATDRPIEVKGEMPQSPNLNPDPGFTAPTPSSAPEYDRYRPAPTEVGSFQSADPGSVGEGAPEIPVVEINQEISVDVSINIGDGIAGSDSDASLGTDGADLSIDIPDIDVNVDGGVELDPGVAEAVDAAVNEAVKDAVKGLFEDGIQVDVDGDGIGDFELSVDGIDADPGSAEQGDIDTGSLNSDPIEVGDNGIEVDLGEASPVGFEPIGGEAADVAAPDAIKLTLVEIDSRPIAPGDVERLVSVEGPIQSRDEAISRLLSKVISASSGPRPPIPAPPAPSTGAPADRDSIPYWSAIYAPTLVMVNTPICASPESYRLVSTGF